jgi:hypothetical protein
VILSIQICLPDIYTWECVEIGDNYSLYNHALFQEQPLLHWGSAGEASYAIFVFTGSKGHHRVKENLPFLKIYSP